MLTQKLPLDLMQTQWAQQLNPIIANPMTNPLILKNVALVAGTNAVNHRLGRNLQGWNPTRIRSSAVIHDQQDTNQTPSLTLLLVSTADVVVDLMVF